MACVRTANVAKYLSRTGWDVTVVTPDPALWQLTDVPDRTAGELAQWNIHMLHTAHRWQCLCGYMKHAARPSVKWFAERIVDRFARMMKIDALVGWYPEAERACAKLRPGDVHVILATGCPFGTFRVAARLGRRLRCPYVLDYRDLWSGNPHNHSASRDRHRRTEQRLLDGCTAASVVSPSIAGYLDKQFHVGQKVRVIPNGYDPAAFQNVEPKAFGHFAIVYSGHFHPPERTAEPIMQTLRLLAANYRNKAFSLSLLWLG